jgi:RNA polymerase sigma factor (sigma-70 family)
MFSLLVALSFIVSGLALGKMIASFVVLRKVFSSPLHLLFLLAAMSLTLTKIAEQIAPVLKGELFFLSLNLAGILFLTTTWFCFCLRLLFVHKNLKLPLVLLLYLIPVILTVLAITNLIPNLFWPLSDSGYGIGYYLLIAYAAITAYGGLFPYIKKLLRQALYAVRFTVILAVFIVVPLGIYLADYFTAQALMAMDVISLHFSLLSLLFFYFLFFYYPFGEMLPYKDLLNGIADPVAVINSRQQIIFSNQKMLALLNRDPEQVLGKDFKLIFPELTFLKQTLASFSFHRQVVLFSSVTYDLNILPILDWMHRDKGKILIFHDISGLKVTEKNLKQLYKQIEQEVVSRVQELKRVNETLNDSNQALIDEIAQRKKAERVINTALEEKNILICEIHHRVKNNLQIIISLLNLQRRYFEDENMREIFRSTVNRIRSIGMIHEKLYKAGDLVNTNIADYINDLSHYLLHSFEDKTQQIKLSVDVEQIFLDLNRSILCGLIINELASNSIKHAFPPELQRKDDEINEITIRFISRGQNLELIVGDNGIGIPQDLDIENLDSLGMKIISTLVKQLKSTMEIKHNNGTEVKITFPKEQPLSDIYGEQQEMLNRIQQALNALPNRIKKTTFLYYLDGKSIAEVSKSLGLSVENVQSQLQLARKHLKELLTKSVS